MKQCLISEKNETNSKENMKGGKKEQRGGSMNYYNEAYQNRLMQ